MAHSVNKTIQMVKQSGDESLAVQVWGTFGGSRHYAERRYFVCRYSEQVIGGDDGDFAILCLLGVLTELFLPTRHPILASSDRAIWNKNSKY